MTFVPVETYGIVDDETSEFNLMPTIGVNSSGGGGHPPAVALIERERERVFRLQAFGQYEADMVTSTMQSRDHKYATDLVVTP